ncbi:MAG: selenocysteine-specific translation elongation factor [Anaerolineales bacterium]|nr:selenocysteine-specific translation elongation factor [Anaerolineales bacterium]
MRVIGTAGHVDHGKSTLVQALTGINPDRLIEEQARQMTIDLGFAWLQLPNGEMVGVVDVPGHEDFIENMLAGVGGIDAAVLVIAADEGVMPQTREHLAILDLLAIPQLVVALTKIDMVDDPEWRELVILDVHEVLETTRYADALIVPVSAHTGEGLTTLLDTLITVLDTLQPHTPDGIPRLPIDRVFTLSGFGTVVTGTLLDGPLKVGETLEIQPTGRQARIRGLHSHNEPVEVALPGSRTAVNLSGVEKDELQRGYVLSRPGAIHPTQLLDVELLHLADAPRPLKHNTEIKVFLGTSEALGRVRLLMDDALVPGATGWAQLQLNDLIPALRGQRFIIRLPSPAATIGGGVILDTAPGRKWKRHHPDLSARFGRLSSSVPIDLVSECLIATNRPMLAKEVMATTQINPIPDDEQLIWFGDWVTHVTTLENRQRQIEQVLGSYHQAEPLQAGMHRNTLRTKLRLEADAFEVLFQLMKAHEVVGVSAGRIHLADFQVQYTRAQQAAIEKAAAAFQQSPYTPPSVKDTITLLGDEALLNALINQGELVKLNAEVVLAADVYREWVLYAKRQLEAGHALQVGAFRDQFNTTRKYALGFLEHLEAHQLTRRVGDEHVARGGDWGQLLSPNS